MKPDKIDQFLEGLLKEKEITDLSPEAKKQVLTEMRQILLSQAEAEILASLPKEQADDLTDKMKNPDFKDEDIATFLSEAGVDIDEVMEKTMALYRNFYLEEAK